GLAMHPPALLIRLPRSHTSTFRGAPAIAIAKRPDCVTAFTKLFKFCQTTETTVSRFGRRSDAESFIEIVTVVVVHAKPQP
ncbi:MAG: hypothetical protein ACRDT5_16705, partial [Mycobacterium sp.]